MLFANMLTVFPLLNAWVSIAFGVFTLLEASVYYRPAFITGQRLISTYLLLLVRSVFNPHHTKV